MIDVNTTEGTVEALKLPDLYIEISGTAVTVRKDDTDVILFCNNQQSAEKFFFEIIKDDYTNIDWALRRLLSESRS